MAQFDHMIASPPAPIVPNDQPPALQTLQAKSGKSINATTEEFNNAVKDAEQELMMNPPNMSNQDVDVDFLAKVKAYNKLSEEYDNGEDPSSNDDEDEIMDDLFSNEPMDNGQAQDANDFSMFAPDEQSSVDQMFSDIDAINANDPYTEEEDVAPLDMDALADIASGEDNNDNPMDELGAGNSPPTQAVDKLDETVGSWSEI
jgi:hypothetical protein